jgi:hypothetical protein
MSYRGLYRPGASALAYYHQDLALDSPRDSVFRGPQLVDRVHAIFSWKINPNHENPSSFEKRHLFLSNIKPQSTKLLDNTPGIQKYFQT